MTPPILLTEVFPECQWMVITGRPPLLPIDLTTQVVQRQAHGNSGKKRHLLS
jgi:hypothetical protein